MEEQHLSRVTSDSTAQIFSVHLEEEEEEEEEKRF
jgi:hypothetical protein